MGHVKEILLNNGYIIKKVKPVINGKQVNCEIIKKIEIENYYL